MGSIKAVLRQKENKDGTFPLAIRITKDRKSSYIYIGQHLDKKYWDPLKRHVKKSHPNSARLNNLIAKKIAETNNKLLEIETEKGEASAISVRKSLKPEECDTFFSQSKIYIDRLKTTGKFNQRSADEPRLKHFREFLNGADINFKDITIPLLTNFAAYLKGTRNISERTIVNHLVVIRTVYSQAIKANIVDSKHYPFGKGKIKIKFPQSNKVGLSTDDVLKLEAADLSDRRSLDHARKLWLLSFYFAGIRVSDLLRLRWSDIQNDRLHYTMGKNAKAGSFKVSEKAQKILISFASVKKNETDLIFPELKVLKNLDNTYLVQKEISNADSKLNKALKKIANMIELGKTLTMHISRHTFGNLSGDLISIQMLQKLYRHTSITTTIGYQANFIHKDADDALESVLNY